jgi:hypothetical protein
MIVDVVLGEEKFEATALATFRRAIGSVYGVVQAPIQTKPESSSEMPDGTDGRMVVGHSGG